MRKILVLVAGLCTIALVGIATAPSAVAKAHHGKVNDPTVYDSIVNPSTGNLPSWAFQATGTAEFGNQITFAGTARVLDNVVVQMSSWVCGNLQGGTSCATTPGATFTEPITLNIYNAPALGNSAPEGTLITPGARIASETVTFAIPYRPSADNVNCTGANAGAWYDTDIDQATGNPIGCLNGLLDDITFNFGHLTLPNNVVYGIAYNTTTYGYQPYGNTNPCDAATSCGYDGLNVGLTTASSPSVGSDPDPGSLFHNAAGTYGYCDGGTSPGAGVGVFRLDSPGPNLQCWEPGANDTPPYYIPSVQFNAVDSPAATITSANNASVVAGTPFSFTVTTTGVPTPVVTKGAGKLPKGLTFVNNGNGTATISGTASVTNRDHVYKFIVRAKNASHSIAKQPFSLTLTGGKA
jgi:hypothetical protein